MCLEPLDLEGLLKRENEKQRKFLNVKTVKGWMDATGKSDPDPQATVNGCGNLLAFGLNVEFRSHWGGIGVQRMALLSGTPQTNKRGKGRGMGFFYNEPSTDFSAAMAFPRSRCPQFVFLTHRHSSFAGTACSGPPTPVGPGRGMVVVL